MLLPCIQHGIIIIVYKSHLVAKDRVIESVTASRIYEFYSHTKKIFDVGEGNKCLHRYLSVCLNRYDSPVQRRRQTL